MAIKRYRIFLGMCGPTPLKTNIINAENKRDAVIKYFSDSEEELSEDRIQEYVRNTREVLPSPNRQEGEPVLDAFGKPFSEGCLVAAIVRNNIVYGTVKKITNKSIVIASFDGKDETRLTCESSSFRVNHALVMKNRKPRTGEKLDATGLPVNIGDRVVFVEDDFHRKSLRQGKVIELKNVKVLVEYGSGANREKTLKSLSKIIVL